MNKYNIDDVVYFISNGYIIREATVIRAGAGFCTIRFNDGQTPKGTRVRGSKLFQTEKEAENAIKKSHEYS